MFVSLRAFVMRRQLKHGESFCECFGVHRTSSSSHGRAEQRLSNQDRSLFVASTGFYLRLLSLNPEQTESITAHSGTCLSTSRRSVRLPVCLPVCTSEREYLSLIYPCVCVRACLSACLPACFPVCLFIVRLMPMYISLHFLRP